MNFFTKIVINSVALILISVVFIGLLFLRIIQTNVIDQTLTYLDSIASIEGDRIADNLEQYIDETKLVGSRTQLRRSLQSYTVSENDADIAIMNRILEDAQVSSGRISGITILNTNGKIVLQTNPDERSTITELNLERAKKNFFLGDIHENVNGELRINGLGPLLLDGEVLGVLVVSFNPTSIIEITEDYTGLGATGELLLATELENGDALLVTPLRFDSNAALNRIIDGNRTNAPIQVALDKEERILDSEDSVDYRGEVVFAVTRYIDGINWGLVAKIDQSEVLAPIQSYRQAVFAVVLMVLFFGLITAWITTREITRPLRMFSDLIKNASEDIRTISFPAQLLSGNDEIAILANNFKVLSSELTSMYDSLEAKVSERTYQLEEAQRIGRFGNFSWNINTNAVYWSDQAFIIHGWTKEKNLHCLPPSKKYFERIHSDDRKGIKKKIEQAKNEVEFEYTYRIELPHSEIRWVNVRSKKSINHSGEQLVEGTFQDVTDAMLIDQAKSEFVSLASHQLRTPLSAINWYTEILLEGDAGKINKEQKDYLNEIYVANQRMVTLVNALLNVSRLELNTFVIDPKEAHIRTVIRDVKKELQPQIDHRKLKLVSRVSKEVPKMMLDVDMMQIVIHNLLTNAIKYTPKNGKINLLATVEEDQLVISVADTGIGIPKGDQQYIFTKLYRANNVRNTDTDGTGLGLYMIQQIVEHSKGTITFESVEDEGTTFFVRIPLSGMTKKDGKKKLM